MTIADFHNDILKIFELLNDDTKRAYMKKQQLKLQIRDSIKRVTKLFEKE